MVVLLRVVVAHVGSRPAAAAAVVVHHQAELKHGRVAMLAALGMTVQEHWHPLFGLGDKEMVSTTSHHSCSIVGTGR